MMIKNKTHYRNQLSFLLAFFLNSLLITSPLKAEAVKGPELIFEVNVPYFICHTLSTAEKPWFNNREKIGGESRAAIIAFRDYMRAICPDEYQNFLNLYKDEEKFIDRSLLDQHFEFIGSETFYRLAQESDSFKTLLQQVEEYAIVCKNQWETNFSVSYAKISDLIGTPLAEKKIHVFITHPKLYNGCFLDETHIAWGHREDWPNYTTIYLWHEVLHTYDEYWKSDKEHIISHSLIQFMTDNELRVFFNGGTYPPFVGHNWLNPAMEQILPYWNQYLAKAHTEHNLKSFIRELLEIFPDGLQLKE